MALCALSSASTLYPAAPAGFARYGLPVAETKVITPQITGYDFGYDVSDPQTGDVKAHHESRRGDAVSGSYSLLESDGTTRTVDYTADGTHGFNAVVRKAATLLPAPIPHEVALPAAPIVREFALPVAQEVHHVAPLPVAQEVHHVAQLPLIQEVHHVAPLPVAQEVRHVASLPVAHEVRHVAPLPVTSAFRFAQPQLALAQERAVLPSYAYNGGYLPVSYSAPYARHYPYAYDAPWSYGIAGRSALVH